MAGVCGEDKLASPHTEQVVNSHQAQHAFVIYCPAAAHQFAMYSTIAVGGPVQCNLLDLIPQVRTVGARGTTSPKAVISGPAHARKLAQSIHACPRFARFLDLLVDVLAPLSASGRGRSLKRCKTFFKKSISIACWPILRSSSAMSSVSS